MTLMCAAAVFSLGIAAPAGAETCTQIGKRCLAIVKQKNAGDQAGTAKWSADCRQKVAACKKTGTWSSPNYTATNVEKK
jgi:hypothetical protein